MGLNRLRQDSIEELCRRKTLEAVQKESEQLRERVMELEQQLTNTQLALCDAYELWSKEGS